MALSNKQKEDLRPREYFFMLPERDLLYLAARYEGWLNIAVDCGFSLEKVMQPWTFKDAGRMVRVMRWEEFREVFGVS